MYFNGVDVAADWLRSECFQQTYRRFSFGLFIFPSLVALFGSFVPSELCDLLSIKHIVQYSSASTHDLNPNPISI